MGADGTTLTPQSNAARLVAIYGVGYLALNELGVRLALPPAGFSVFWPAAGLALAVFLEAPYRWWGGLAVAQAIANLFGNVSHGTSVGLSLSFVAANLLESMGGAVMVREWRRLFPHTSRSTELLVSPLLGSVVNTMIGALVAAPSLVWFGHVQGGFGLVWRTWWVADFVGILAVAPVVLLWRTGRSRFRSRALAGELVAAVTLAWTVVILIFTTVANTSTPRSVVYLMVPALLWPAVRLGRIGAATAFAGAIVIAVWLTSRGEGPFVRNGVPTADDALDVQLFLSVLGATLLVVGFSTELMRRAEREAAVMSTERAERGRLEELLLATAVLAEEREELLEQANLLAEVSEVLDEALTVDAQLARLADVLSRRLGAWCGIDLLVHDATGAQLQPRVQAGPIHIETHVRPAPTAPPVSRALEGEPVLVELVTDEGLRHRAGSPERFQSLARHGFVSAMVAPITTAGAVYGLINLVSVDDDVVFDDADLRLAFDVGRRAGQAVRNAQQYEREREISTRLQASLLPDSLPNHPGVQLAARYLPGEEGLDVGGDWYDAFLVGDARLAVVVGDIVGGGLQAASVTGQLRSAVRALSRRCDGPADVLSELDAFAAVVTGADVATLAYLELDVDTGTVRYACAGHPPPLVTSPDGTFRFLEGGRSTPLVTVAEPKRVEATAVLAAGETLFLYTDGLFERRGETISDGLARLAVVAADRLDESTLDTVVDELVHRLLGERGPSDDVCVVAIARPVLDPLRLRRVIAADPAKLAGVRGEFRSWLRRRGLDEPDIADVLLATFEAAANAIEHAYHDRRPGTVSIDARLVDDLVVVEVHDQGSWRLPPAPGERGRGTHLMNQLMDSVETSCTPTGTRVELRRALRCERGRSAPQ